MADDLKKLDTPETSKLVFMAFDITFDSQMKKVPVTDEGGKGYVAYFVGSSENAIKLRTNSGSRYGQLILTHPQKMSQEDLPAILGNWQRKVRLVQKLESPDDEAHYLGFAKKS